MTGRRRRDVDLDTYMPPDPQPGDYWTTAEDRWWCVTPSGSLGNLSAHKVVEHEDGTISVSPSILVTETDGDTKRQWHGWLQRGVWRDA